MTDLIYSLEETAEKLGMSETVLLRLSQYFRIPQSAYEKEGYLSFKGELYFAHQDLRFFRQVRDRIVDGDSLSDIKEQIPMLDEHQMGQVQSLNVVPKAVDVKSESALELVSVSKNRELPSRALISKKAKNKSVFEKIAEQTRGDILNESSQDLFWVEKEKDTEVKKKLEDEKALDLERKKEKVLQNRSEINAEHNRRLKQLEAKEKLLLKTKQAKASQTQKAGVVQDLKESPSAYSSHSSGDKSLWGASGFGLSDPLRSLFPEKPSEQDPLSLKGLAIDEKHVHRQGKVWPKQELPQELAARGKQAKNKNEKRTKKAAQKKTEAQNWDESLKDEARLVAYSKVGETFSSGFEAHSGLRGTLQRAASQLRERALGQAVQPFSASGKKSHLFQ